MMFFFGVFLSDLSQHPPHIDWLSNHKWTSYVFSPILILFGLLLASYPEDKVQWSRWSEIMGQYSVYIFPRDVETPRYYTGVGLIFICLGIHFSNSVKNVLSNKYLLWFGKNSFAVYLIHGSLLRTILVWMYFGIFTPADIVFEDGRRERGHLPYPGRLRWYFWMPIWFAILYWVANLWTKYVDPWCARVTESLAGFVFEQGSDETFSKRTLPK